MRIASGLHIHMHSHDGSTFLREMSLWPKSWCDVKSKIRLRLWMRIYLKNNRAMFHTDPLWNDRAFGFFWRRSPQQGQEQQDELRYMRSVSDQKSKQSHSQKKKSRQHDRANVGVINEDVENETLVDWVDINIAADQSEETIVVRHKRFTASLRAILLFRFACKCAHATCIWRTFGAWQRLYNIINGYNYYGYT